MNSFVLFLEEFPAWQIVLQINWPLDQVAIFDLQLKQD